MKILAIESSCDETAAAVVSYQLSDYGLLQNRNSNSTKPKSDGRSLIAVDILSNIVSSQIDLHAKFGGVFPEIASRAHTESIIPVVQEALIESSQRSDFRLQPEIESRGPKSESGKLKDIDLVAVTAGPGLIGSLLVGVNTAKTLAMANNLPIIGINHWLGHIYSAWPVIPGDSAKAVVNSDSLLNNKSPNHNQSQPITFPLLALIVSGGHTGLVLMRSHTEYETIGQTLDDAAGEAFDKVAKILGLGYPGGPAISTEAEKYSIQQSDYRLQPKSEVRSPKADISFPRSMLDRENFNFSFSGLKTAVLYKVKELEKEVINSDSMVIHGDSLLNDKSPNHNQSQPITANVNLPNHYKSLVAAEFQQTVVDILIGKTLKAAEKYQPKSIVLCGGVSANKELRSQMASSIENWKLEIGNSDVSFHFPEMKLCGDNAAMIGIAAAYQIANGIPTTDYSQIKADSNLKL